MNKTNTFKNILIIGMAGGLAKIVTSLLVKEYPNAIILGVDSRSIEHDIIGENVKYYQMPYTRSRFEKIFRETSFDAVFHLARMSHANSNPKARLSKRLSLNLMGTRRILDLSLKFGVKKIIILSTFHAYGALPENPAFIKEDAPLKASEKYPELLDIVEMDQIVTGKMWKDRGKIDIVEFRPCNIIGKEINNSMCRYLTTPLSPVPIDFNPMMQFIHEFDMARVLVKALTSIPTGVYNVATDQVISIREAKKMTKTAAIPISLFLASIPAYLLNRTILNIPAYLIDYLKYPCLIDNSELKKHLGDDFFRFSIEDAIYLLSSN